jgi:sodium/potassium-transporting ATPase subunit alpha
MVRTISALSRDAEEQEIDEKVTSNGTAVTSVVISGPELITLNDNQWNALCKYN